jgi:glyoxalase superfamily protein
MTARVPEGKTVKNRLHIDVIPTDREQDEKIRRLLDLGASRSCTVKAVPNQVGPAEIYVARSMETLKELRTAKRSPVR